MHLAQRVLLALLSAEAETGNETFQAFDLSTEDGPHGEESLAVGVDFT